MVGNPLKDVKLTEILERPEWWNSPKDVAALRAYYRTLHQRFGEEEEAKTIKKNNEPKKTKKAASIDDVMEQKL